MEKNTPFLDGNNRRIKMVKIARKKRFFVRKRNSEGKFVKVVRKAMYRADGRNIRTLKSVPKSIRSNASVNNRHHTTMDGLSCWHKRLFEHFGWMILAKAKGYGYKIPAYKRGIKDFIKSAEQLNRDYKNGNRKHDVKVLMKNVKVLDKFAKML